MRVTALLVSHNGARWLPAVLEGLAEQTRGPDRFLAVDTGSSDGSVDLLAERLGAESILDAPSRTSFPDAVARGLDHLPPLPAGDRPEVPGDGEWIWLLHDDSRPAPDALERMLDVVEADPSVSILGPKHREWPSLRRLLEVGVTMSGTGRRETGLERGEYDQGQHDRLREVLAVGSAGMLIRRDVLEELGGFDRRLPVFGNDVDLGWRAARAGHPTVVVPDAVVFHVEAAHRGVRRTPLTGNHRQGERSAALYTLLANCSALALPFVAVRLFLGSLLRALALLLVRAPREALDELVALGRTYARPDVVLKARWRRRRTARVPARAVRHLLAPPWLPYRHGLDFVSDMVMAVVHQATDVSSSRRSTRPVAETGPVPDDAAELPADSGLLTRILTSPTAGVLALLLLMSLVGARGLLGGGFLSGGALLPAPVTSGDWWSLYLEGWHENGVGSAVPAAPYVLPLAVVGTVLMGKAWLVVDLLFLLAVPLSALGAWRLLRTLTGPGVMPLWGAVAYGLLPVLTGAVAQGRVGTVAAAVILPGVVHAALFLGPERSRDRRWRAAWRTALLLALLTAFVPLAWVLALVLAGVVGMAGLVQDRPTWTSTETWSPIVVALGAVPVLLLPWTLLRPFTDAVGPWYAEAGLPATDLVVDLGAWEILGGRAATVDLGAAPAWFGIGIALAAVAALLRPTTRRTVVGAWVVVLVALLTVLVLDAAGEWAGFPVLLWQAAAVLGVSVAGSGIAARISGSSFGWRQPVGLLVVVGALLAPVAGLAWWAATGVAGPLDRGPVHAVPAYMIDAALRDPDEGVLVVREEGAGLGYTLLRTDGARLGEDTVAADSEAQRELAALVSDLATAPTAQHVETLSTYGVEFIYLPPPADADLVGSLDSVSGLRPASAVRPGSRAWQLDADPSRESLPEPEGALRPLLLAVQAFAVLAAAVLAAPTRRVRP